jgi:hypothetical protein
MDKMLFTVSTSVSPFFTELLAAEKFTTSADRRFSANSKDKRVRVEFSKNKLAMVISLSEGTFFDRSIDHFFESIGCLKNQLNILLR